MKSEQPRNTWWPALLAVGISSLLTASAWAQVKTTTNTAVGQATKEVSVERGEVVSVEGNDLFVKMENGEIRHFPNVPESARATVDGKAVGIHDLKPGMKLERTITTTKTPQVVTTVQTVTGKVWHVNPPTTVILTLEDGKNQQFKIPKGQKFNIDGQMVDAFGLKQGMKISATKIVEVPENVITQEKAVTGTMPPPPDQPILIAGSPAAPATPAAEEATPAKLPKTGSSLPLIGVLGLICCGASFGLSLVRKHLAA